MRENFDRYFSLTIARWLTHVYDAGDPAGTSTTPRDVTPYMGSLDSARQFAQVCNDLIPGGKDAYVLYRILSAYSHASVQVVDLYFAPGATGGIPSSRAKADGTIGQSGLLFLTASAMIWSARAHSYLSQDKTHRNSLRRAARALGINAELQLSESYYRRHARGGSPK